MNTKKCSQCSEVKPFTDFPKDRTTKDGTHAACRVCKKKWMKMYRNTERGYLTRIYKDMRREHKVYFTIVELQEAFEKHKNIYGMKSAWGPGPNHLHQHLPVTIITKMNGDAGLVITASNLSVDRLDSNREYTLQNIIFIRCDENRRKNNSSYNDCKIHMRLHEERFIKMKAI